MKNKVLIITTLLFSINLSSKSQHNGIELSGGFGGAFTNSSIKSGSTAIGGGGAMLFNRNFFFGGFGKGTSGMVSNKSDLTNYSNYEIEAEMGGLWVGYIFRTKSLDYTFSVKTAWGEIMLNETDLKTKLYDGIFVLTPSLEIEKRFFSIFKLGIGLYYDMYSGVDLLTYSDKSFSGLGLSVSFRSGVF